MSSFSGNGRLGNGYLGSIGDIRLAQVGNISSLLALCFATYQAVINYGIRIPIFSGRSHMFEWQMARRFRGVICHGVCFAGDEIGDCASHAGVGNPIA